MTEGVSAQNETGGLVDARRSLLLGLQLIASPVVRIRTFALTTFVATALLIILPVVLAQLLLPKLGGVPAVWSVTLAFTFAAIAGGVAYGYALTRFVSLPVAIALHVCLSALATGVILFGTAGAGTEPAAGTGYVWLIGLLLKKAGLPVVTASASIALLQRWTVGDGDEGAVDILFLRSVAVGSAFAAAGLFAVLIDGRVGLGAQVIGIKVAAVIFCLLVALSAGLAWMSLQSAKAGDSDDNTHFGDDFSTTFPLTTRFRWILLAAVPSALLVAATACVSVGRVAAPIVWLALLVVYLISLHLGWRASLARRRWLPLALFVLILLQMPALPFAGQIWLVVPSVFLASVSCHRALFALQPAQRHRPEFALFVVAGMAIGSFVAAVLMPQLFVGRFDVLVLLILALFCLPGILVDARDPLNVKRVFGIAAVLLALLLVESEAVRMWALRGQQIILCAVIAVTGFSVFATRDWATQRVVVMLGLLAVGLAWPDEQTGKRAYRSFFGTVEELSSVGREDFGFVTLGRAMDAVRLGKDAQPNSTAEDADSDRKALSQGPILVGVVGIGTGQIACTRKPGDVFRYFEINPSAISLARNGFPFLAKCTPDASIIPGDASASLTREPAEAFDFLTIDLTSNEALPAHFLTVEAIRLFMSRVSETGILVLRFDNQWFDLIPQIASAIDAVSGVQAAVVRQQSSTASAGSTSVLVAKHPRALDEILKWSEVEGLPRNNSVPWTHDLINASKLLRNGVTK